MNKENMIADEAENYGKQWALFGSKEALSAAFTDGANYAMSLSNWIRVEDELPEAECFYTVYANGGVHHMYYGLNNRGNIVWWRNDEQVRPHMIPTHWQPLPTPPQTN